MQVPGAPVLIAMAAVAVALVALHAGATQGTGILQGRALATAAVTPATTLTVWWHHLWAGFFHKSWGHLAFNLAVFAVAFPLAARQMPAWQTFANAYWIGPFTVLALHLVLVLPLASAGVPYAVRALDIPLVGFSVMAYSMAGMALTLASPTTAAWVTAALLAFELASAVLVTGPFVAVYHVAGFGMGYWTRVLLLRASTA